ncbi:MAG: hypothetical protein MZV70_60830 [Desulfobacterales bacterium]|nr:hypothetical protein [Desulfobacterales bacterium]
MSIYKSRTTPDHGVRRGFSTPAKAAPWLKPSTSPTATRLFSAVPNASAPRPWMSRASGSSPPLRFKLTCPCGHVASAVLEKRKRFRKGAHLPGTYVHYVNGQPQGKGTMTVKDLSTKGMKLVLTGRCTVAPGDSAENRVSPR